MIKKIYKNRFYISIILCLLACGFGYAYFADFYIKDVTVFFSLPFIGRPVIPLSAINPHCFNGFLVCTTLGVGIPVMFPSSKRKTKVCLSLAGMSWTIDDLSRGMLITGITGSGKTASAISHILRQLFTRVPDFGGLCLDMKGNFFIYIEKIAKALGCEGKLVTLAVRPETTVIRLKLNNQVAVKDLQKKICDAVDKYNIKSGLKNAKKANDVSSIAQDGQEYYITMDFDHLDTEFFMNLVVDDITLLENQSVRKIGSIPASKKDWQPKYRYNLLSYEGIPLATLAKMITDTGSALGGKSSGGSTGDYFVSQGKIHLAKALYLIDSIQWMKEKCPEIVLTMKSLDDRPKKSNVKELSDKDIWNKMPDYKSFTSLADFFLDGWIDKKYISWLREKLLAEDSELHNYPERAGRFDEELTHFSLLLKKGENELGSVIGTIQNFLAFFQEPDIAEVFSARENSIEFEMVDAGKIFSVSIPQRFQDARKYVNTFMKMIYYYHALQRFGKNEALKRKNQLFLIMDEAQGGVTAASGSLSDHEVLDRTRESKSTVIFATQSTRSFNPVIDIDSKNTLLDNLANQIHYKAADTDNAEYIADKIGKEEVRKYNYNLGGSKSGTSRSYSMEEKFKITPSELRNFKKFECVVIHCEKGGKRQMLPPVTPDGKTPDYYYDL